jgi:hypothetical protein
MLVVNLQFVPYFVFQHPAVVFMLAFLRFGSRQPAPVSLYFQLHKV